MKEPPRIARLEHDKKHGYPIPWNVLRGKDGIPLFTVGNDVKHYTAIRQGLCPICGEKLGRWKWFIGGPRSAFDEHGWYLDLPGHHECIQFSAATCPYLSIPKYVREIGVPNPNLLTPDTPPIFIDQTVMPERPQVFVLVAAATLEIRDNGAVALPYVRPRQRLGYEFWRYGKQLTVDEALPYLREALGAEWELPEVEEMA